MLLVKCPKCDASYKLSEDLYRRKAAGHGVVVTCRRCKAEIHVDEKQRERAELDDRQAVPDPPTVPPPPPEPLEPVTSKAAPVPVPSKPASTGVAAQGKPLVTKPALRSGATLIGVAPPRHPAPPRPNIVAPRPSASQPNAAPAPLEANTDEDTPTRLMRVDRRALLQGRARAPEREPPSEPSTPMLVALSPGLLNVGAPPPPPPPPPPPESDERSDAEPETERPPPPVDEEPTETLPVVTADLLPPVEEEGPDSAAPVDSRDFVAEAPKPRLPQAPPARKLPGAPRPPHPAEPPSVTSAPKLEALVHEASPRKDGPPRKRQPSGDLTDDLFSADVGFEARPPLAPPDANALTRAPVSSRRPPASAEAQPLAASDAKKPAPPSQESKTTRGLIWVLVLSALAGTAFAFRGRFQKTDNDAAATATSPVAVETAAPTAEATPSPEAVSPAPTTTASADDATPPSTIAEGVAPTAPTVMSQRTPEADAPNAPTRTPATSSPDATAPSVAAAKPSPPTPTAAGTAAPGKPTAVATPPPPPVGTASEPFDTAAARAALDAAAAQASSCRKPGDPSGVAVVTLIFSPSGRVTSATIAGPPFAATPTGGCIASTLRKARVPPFAGEMMTVRKTVTIQ